MKLQFKVSLDFVYKGPIYDKPPLVSLGNGLVPNRQQATLLEPWNKGVEFVYLTPNI